MTKNYYKSNRYWQKSFQNSHMAFHPNAGKIYVYNFKTC